MRILIVGGTGFIGGALQGALAESGHDVVISSRRKDGSEGKLTWRPPELLPPEVISQFEAVVNLAGEPIAPKRWTRKRKQKILSSRVDTTRSLVESIRRADSKPHTLINASAVGIYGPCGDECITEESPLGCDFLATVCRKWEEEALRAEELGVRVVRLRIGCVLEADGGALPRLMLPFRFFLGGPLGSGRQWVSWIHRDDVVGLIEFALQNEAVSGPLNATAPNPVTNKEFSKALGKAMHRPCFFAVPGFLLKLALGELAGMLLTGQRVLPEKALKAGYRFKYATLEDALKAILEDQRTTCSFPETEPRGDCTR